MQSLLGAAAYIRRYSDTKIVIVTVILWRAVLEIINQLVPLKFLVVPSYPDALTRATNAIESTGAGLSRWAHWDGVWYMDIVLNGYRIAEDGKIWNIAFFPLFPLLTKGISYFGFGPLIAGLVLNVVLTIVAGVLIIKLSRVILSKYFPEYKKNSRELSIYAFFAFLAYPSAFFLVSYYADALLAVLVTGAVYFALKDKFIIASTFTFFAVLTKSTGLLLVPTILTYILVEKVLPQRKISLAVLLQSFYVCLAGLVGLVLFMAYSKHVSGDYLAFIHVQELWHRYVSADFVKRLYEIYYAHLSTPSYFGGRFNYILMIFVMSLPFIVSAISVWAAIRRRAYWLLPLVFGTLFLALSSAVMQSLNRYFISITPLFIFGMILIYKKFGVRVFATLVVISFVLQLYFLTGFIRGFIFAG